MRAKEKRGRGLSPLVIRALGVLAISLMAMTTSLASSTGVPTCERVCDRIAETDCDPLCKNRQNIMCIPFNTNRWCFDNCVYTWQCIGSSCEGRNGPGKRLECTLRGPKTPTW